MRQVEGVHEHSTVWSSRVYFLQISPATTVPFSLATAPLVFWPHISRTETPQFWLEFICTTQYLYQIVEGVKSFPYLTWAVFIAKEMSDFKSTRGLCFTYRQNRHYCLCCGSTQPSQSSDNCRMPLYTHSTGIHAKVQLCTRLVYVCRSRWILASIPTLDLQPRSGCLEDFPLELTGSMIPKIRF